MEAQSAQQGPKTLTPHVDVRLAELAARQYGVVNLRQLKAIGMTEKAIRHRVAVRRLQPVTAKVFAVGRAGLSARGLCMAAVLSCPAGTVLSHRSAAALWDLRRWPSRAEVTARVGARRRGPFAIHQSRSLPGADVTHRNGIPCTTPARTLVDLAAVDPHGLERALEQSLTLGLFDLAAVDAVLARATGRRGTGELRRLLASLREPAPVNSELERRFLGLVRTAGLPAPAVNVLVEGHRVDFHWRTHRLVVETDGRATHDNALAFQRDRRRDLDLELAGWHVLRIGWRQVVEEPRRVAVLLGDRLSRPATRT